jgi:predicted permease
MQMLDLQAGLTGRVLLWTLGVSLAAGILVGILPAFHATRADPHESLKADGRTGGAASGSWLRSTLVVAEIALAVVLLIGAGLLMRSFVNLQRVEPGFEADGVLTMRLTLPRDKYPGEAANVFFDRLAEEIGATAGVRSVATASQFPPSAMFDTQFTLERSAAEGGTLPTALITVASPAYFGTLSIPLRTGRAFGPGDRLDAPPVAIVNEAFAARYLPGTGALGQRIRIGDPRRPRPWATIVGVAADARNSGPTRPVRPEIYVPVRQQTVWNQLFVLVRSEMDAAALLPAVRASVRALDPEQPVYAIQTLEQAMAESALQQRVAAAMTGIFAGVALLLAAAGIFGVMSYSVSARTQEMGVRLAVGAEPRDITWLILRQVLRLAAVGLAVGVGLLLAVGRALSGLLFGVAPSDPATLVAVAALLGAVALFAAWFPAARASRVDPITALRYE